MRALGFVLAAALAVAGCGLVGQTQQLLRTAVDARGDRLAACYLELLDRDPSATGSMRLTLTVRHEQRRVTSVEVVWTELREPEFAACITKQLRRIEIDEPPTSNLAVQYTLTFDQMVPEAPVDESMDVPMDGAPDESAP